MVIVAVVWYSILVCYLVRMSWLASESRVYLAAAVVGQHNKNQENETAHLLACFVTGRGW